MCMHWPLASDSFLPFCTMASCCSRQPFRATPEASDLRAMLSLITLSFSSQSGCHAHLTPTPTPPSCSCSRLSSSSSSSSLDVYFSRDTSGASHHFLFFIILTTPLDLPNRGRRTTTSRSKRRTMTMTKTRTIHRSTTPRRGSDGASPYRGTPPSLHHSPSVPSVTSVRCFPQFASSHP